MRYRRVGHGHIRVDPGQIEYLGFEIGRECSREQRHHGALALLQIGIELDFANRERLAAALDAGQIELHIDIVFAAELDRAGDRLARGRLAADVELGRIDLDVEPVVTTFAAGRQRHAINHDLSGLKVYRELGCLRLEIVNQQARQRATAARIQALDAQLVRAHVSHDLGRFQLDTARLCAMPRLGFEREFLGSQRHRLRIQIELGCRELDLERLLVERALGVQRQLLGHQRHAGLVKLECGGGNLGIETGQIECCRGRCAPSAALGCCLARIATHLRIETRERIGFLLQIKQQLAGHPRFNTRSRLDALNRRSQINLHRHLVGHPASGEVEIRHLDGVARHVILERHARIGNLHGRNIKLDGGWLLLVLGQQIIKVELAVLAANHVRVQTVDLNFVDHDFFFDERHQFEIDLGTVELEKFFFTLEFRQRERAQLNPELGEHRQLQIAGNRQCAVLALFNLAGNVVLVFVRIKRGGENADAGDQQQHCAADDDAKPFENFHDALAGETGCGTGYEEVRW